MTVFRAVESAYERYSNTRERRVVLKSAHARLLDGVGSITEAPDVGALVQHFEIQEALRPLFGKGPPVPPCIGDHPDFEHLKKSDAVEYCAISTLFMDMEGSTRLGLIYPLEKVYDIKNAIICSAIDIVKSFDGHVHRIMGDAVMAYFGGKTMSPEQGAIDAVNCAAVLRCMIERLVSQKLNSQDLNDRFGIRIGVDFGPKDKVLWSAYGYPGMEEVTATSFHVDVASKLQSAAGRNEIMVGQSLQELLDFPTDLLEDKVVTVAGATETQPFVLPNHTNSSGKPINYRKHLLRWREYLRCTRMASQVLEAGASDDSFSVDLAVADTRDDAASRKSCQPCGVPIARGTELRFEASIGLPIHPPFSFDFRVENHGKEAARVKDPAFGNHTTLQRVIRPGVHSVVQWEVTAYRGLHYMNVEWVHQGKKLGSKRLGIYIV